MKKLILAGCLVLAFGCKKTEDNNTVYLWEREFYRRPLQIVSIDNSSLKTGQFSNTSQNMVLVKKENVRLTNAQMRQQQDSLRSESKGMFEYRYKRIK